MKIKISHANGLVLRVDAPDELVEKYIADLPMAIAAMFNNRPSVETPAETPPAPKKGRKR